MRVLPQQRPNGVKEEQVGLLSSHPSISATTFIPRMWPCIAITSLPSFMSELSTNRFTDILIKADSSV